MSHPKTGELWDAGFRAGKYDSTRKVKERLKVIAGLVAGFAATHGIARWWISAAGEGASAAAPGSRLVSRYLGVDISTVALERLPASAIEVLRICKSEWDGSRSRWYRA
ncbi:MAG: hypothetical protein R3D34_05340 [Nitratireductor sp.]